MLKLIRKIFNLDAVDELKRRDQENTLQALEEEQQVLEEVKLAKRHRFIMKSIRDADNAVKAIEDAAQKDWEVPERICLLMDLNCAVLALEVVEYDMTNNSRIAKVKDAAKMAMKGLYAKNHAAIILREHFSALRKYEPELTDIWVDHALVAAAHHVLELPEDKWDVSYTPDRMLEMMSEVCDEIQEELDETTEVMTEEEEAETEVEETEIEESEDEPPYTEEETAIIRAALERIMIMNGRQTPEQGLLALNNDAYINVVESVPGIVDLWRDYANEFDKTEGESFEKLAARTPKDKASIGKMDKTGSVYTGKVMGSRSSFPMAEREIENELTYYIGCFQGNKEELLEVIEETYPADSEDPEDQKHRMGYLIFIKESEEMLLKQNDPEFPIGAAQPNPS